MGEYAIHLGALGFSNPEWVWEPLERLRARRFFLLEAPDDAARRRLAEGGIDIDARLAEAVAGTVSTIEVDLWDPQAVAEVVAHLSHSTHGKPLAANVSCGPNTVTYGIALAGEYHEVAAYYRRPRTTEITWIHHARRPMPAASVQAVLKVMGESSGTMTMAALRKRLVGEHPHVFNPRKASAAEEMSTQSLTNQLSRILDRMQAENLVDRTGSVHKRHASLTETGRTLLRRLALTRPKVRNAS